MPNWTKYDGEDCVVILPGGRSACLPTSGELVGHHVEGPGVIGPLCSPDESSWDLRPFFLILKPQWLRKLCICIMSSGGSPITAF